MGFFAFCARVFRFAWPIAVIAACVGDNTERALFERDVSLYMDIAQSELGEPVLVLDDDAFGEEFLLSSAIVPGPFIPTSNAGVSLQGRIVFFEKHGDRVLILESKEGHSTTPDASNRIILAELPIISESNGDITVDFGQGFKTLFALLSINAENPRSIYEAGEQFQSIQLDSSFIEAMEFKNNHMFIRQQAQVILGTTRQTWELRHMITPYSQNPNFEPKEARSNTFFTGPKRILAQTGKTEINILKRDIANLTVFHISANTPDSLIEAIIDGVDYWNFVFGEPLFETQIAPEGVSAPDPAYNMIQWVENDSAGLAYADMTVDPRTGEIRSSQVYLSSFWKKRGQMVVAAWLLKLKAKGTQTPSGEALEDLVARVSGDIMRTLVAHEIGHVLGLRHNFAGSLASNLSHADIKSSFEDYFINGDSLPKSEKLTSSIMEYMWLDVDVLMGARIRELTNGGVDSRELETSWDRAAVNWAYRNIPLNNTPLFCSEEDVFTFSDCARYDHGADSINFHAANFNRSSEFIAQFLLSHMVSLKSEHGDGFLANLSFPDPLEAALPMAINYFYIIRWLSMNSASLVVHNSVGPYADLKQNEVRESKAALVQRQLEESGGIESLLYSSFVDQELDLQKLALGDLAVFFQLLSSNQSGLDQALEAYNFSDIELTKITEIAPLFIAQYRSILSDFLLQIHNFVTFDVSFAIEELENNTLELLRNYFFEVSQEELHGTYGSSRSLTVRAFLHPFLRRDFALSILNPQRSPLEKGWGLVARSEIKTEIEELVSNTFGLSIDLIEPAQISSRDIRNWFLELKTLWLKISRLDLEDVRSGMFGSGSDDGPDRSRFEPNKKLEEFLVSTVRKSNSGFTNEPYHSRNEPSSFSQGFGHGQCF